MADEVTVRWAPTGVVRGWLSEVAVLRELLVCAEEPAGVAQCPCGGALTYSLLGAMDVHMTSRYRVDPPDDPHNFAGTSVTSEEMAVGAARLWAARRDRAVGGPPPAEWWSRYL